VPTYIDHKLCKWFDVGDGDVLTASGVCNVASFSNGIYHFEKARILMPTVIPPL